MPSDFLIVFDCDGVLVDSERLMQDIDLQMISDLGWPITRTEILNEHLGRAEVSVTANIERHLGHPVPEPSSRIAGPRTRRHSEPSCARCQG